MLKIALLFVKTHRCDISHKTVKSAGVEVRRGGGVRVVEGDGLYLHEGVFQGSHTVLELLHLGSNACQLLVSSI